MLIRKGWIDAPDTEAATAELLEMGVVLGRRGASGDGTVTWHECFVPEAAFKKLYPHWGRFTWSFEELKSKVSNAVAVALLQPYPDGIVKVLLGKRRRQPGIGCWAIPAGGLYFGESWEQAARREMLEELGIEVKLIGGPLHIRSLFPELALHVELTCFWGLPIGDPVNKAFDETEAIGWFGPDLPKPLMRDDDRIVAWALADYRIRGG
jgi:8-oxo-dGTP diphosphatase